jgi:hypothetical protein
MKKALLTGIAALFLATGPANAQANSFFGPPSGSCCNQMNFGPVGSYRDINISPKTGRTYTREADYLTPKVQRRTKRK